MSSRALKILKLARDKQNTYIHNPIKDDDEESNWANSDITPVDAPKEMVENTETFFSEGRYHHNNFSTFLLSIFELYVNSINK